MYSRAERSLLELGRSIVGSEWKCVSNATGKGGTRSSSSSSKSSSSSSTSSGRSRWVLGYGSLDDYLKLMADAVGSNSDATHVVVTNTAASDDGTGGVHWIVCVLSKQAR